MTNRRIGRQQCNPWRATLPLLTAAGASLLAAIRPGAAQVVTITPLPTPTPTPLYRPRPRPTPPPKPVFRRPHAQWKTFLRRVDGAPAVEGRTSYVAAGTYLYQIDSGGRTLWATETGPVHGTPTVERDHVYVGSDTGALYAINRRSGKVVWQFSGATNSILTQPAVAGDIVVAESTDDNVYGIDAASGKPRWHFTRPDGSLGYSSPRYDPDTKAVYVAGETTLYRLRSGNGKAAWSAYVGGKSTSSPEIGGGRVYVGGDRTGLSALSTTSGAPLWNFKGEREDDWFGAPLYAQGTVYVTTYNRYVYAVDAASGKPRWSYRLPGSALSQPAIDARRDTLYVTSTTFKDNPTLTALDIHTGKPLWSDRLGYVGGSAVISADRLFAGSTNGYYYCFTLD